MTSASKTYINPTETEALSLAFLYNGDLSLMPMLICSLPFGWIIGVIALLLYGLSS
jgi:hypothetical protein